MTTLHLALVGDIMLGRTFNRISHANWIDPNLLTCLQRSDLVIGNLETTVTTSSEKWPDKTFNFRADPTLFRARIRQLCQSNQCFLNLANNHSLDYSVSGLNETMQHLAELGIEFAGPRLKSH